jgi:predicted transcriptional regulator
MMAYPHAPAEGRTDTSADAASSIRTLTARVQRAAYHAIAEMGSHGLTTDELAARLGMERTTVQPRTSELRRLGRIIDSGQRRHNRNGKRAIVWTSPAAGGAQ